MKDSFLSIHTLKDLSDFFNKDFNSFYKVIMIFHDNEKYKEFTIPKKNGSTRKISSPIITLKMMQQQLREVLYQIYTTKSTVHGFCRNRSIVTNAQQHLNKRYIFNIDLRNYFDNITFQQVKKVFTHKPFEFSEEVADLLTHLCCYKGSLPQGAPTSPILANFVTEQLDCELENIARINSCVYSRYADDITFSFDCDYNKLPKSIIQVKNKLAKPGKKLTKIIESNEFKINYKKVRLCDINQRMEVTGLTVNNFTNVPRKYIKKLQAILHAWEKFGYKNTEIELNEKYYNKNVKLIYYMKGKLEFLKCVRGENDNIFVKLAARFNNLIPDDYSKFRFKFNPKR